MAVDAIPFPTTSKFWSLLDDVLPTVKPPRTGLGKMMRDLVHRVKKRASKLKGSKRPVCEREMNPAIPTPLSPDFLYADDGNIGQAH